MLWQVRITFLIASALSVCSLAFAQTADYDRRPRTASISGRVIVKGKPAPNITVTVTETQPQTTEVRLVSLGGREFVDLYSYRTTTDSAGRYQIGSLPEGQYLVSTRAPAHVPETKSAGLDTSVRITLDEGEVRDKVDLALVPGGVITGRVTDEAGRPQIGRYVRLTELIGGEWREVMVASWDSLETDDRGVFRIFGQRKGRYIARTGGPDDGLRGAINGKNSQLTYHPDVVRQEEATVIEVAEGMEVTGVDIKLRDAAEVEAFAVSGRVIRAETGKPLPQVNVSCLLVEHQDHEPGVEMASAITDSEGNFVATGLKPGKYKAKVSPREGDEYYSEGKYFEVVAGDVNGIEVLARRGATINGLVIVEEGADAVVQAKLSQTELRAVPNPRTLRNYADRGSKIGSDGSFRVIGVAPGSVVIMISGSSNPFYLMRVERNGVEVSDGLQVGAGEEINGVRVIVGYGGGSIRGSVKVIGGTLPEGVHLAVNVQRQGSPRIGGSGEVDEKGRFLIKGLLTGEYECFVSWGTRNYIPLDPDLKIPQPPKQRVSVTNGAETSMSLTIDLGRKEQEKQ